MYYDTVTSTFLEGRKRRRVISHGECMLEEFGENDRLEDNRGVEGISELCDF